MQDGKALPVENDEQRNSRAQSPPEEPDAEGTAAIAIPIGHISGGVAFVATTPATGRGATLTLRSCVKEDVSRGLGETPATKKVAFGY